MMFLRRVACLGTMLALWALPAHLEQNVVLSTIEATNVLSDSATIRWQSIVPGSSWVDFGPTIEYGKTTGDPTIVDAAHTVQLTDLKNSQLYHYRVRSVDVVGNTIISVDQTLKTPQGFSDSTPPHPINDLRVVEQGFTSVTLEWTATGDDGLRGTALKYDVRRASEDYKLRGDQWFSQTEVLGVPEPQVAGTKQRLVLSNLEPGTIFFIAIRPIDEARNISVPSNILKVVSEPLSIGAFQISNVKILNRTSESIFIQWSTNVPATTEPLFGRTTAYEIPIAANTRKTFDHSMIIGDLEPGTTYHFKLQGMDPLGNTSSTGDLEVSTLR